MAAMPDGSVWIASITNGLAHLTPGRPIEYFQDPQIIPSSARITGLERDPRNGSLWIGYYYGGLARLDGNFYVPFDYRVFGPDLVQGSIRDIQSDNFGGQRRILVAFFGGEGRPGAIGIYTGD
jgi:ligand-binding sensor domain-containing protein